MKNDKYKLKGKPKEYQKDAIIKMSGQNSFAIFDEQGLGKTFTAINSTVIDMMDGLYDKVLVICPTSLIGNWKNEIKKFTHMDTIRISGVKSTKFMKFLIDSDYYIINYESVSREFNKIKYLCKKNKFAIILDESQKIKNPEAQVTKSIHKLIDISTKRYILTGTPIDKLRDIWSQIYFLDKGVSLGKSYSEFQKNFDSNKVMKSIEEIYVRNTKEKSLKLPKKIFNKLRIKMDNTTQRKYDKLKNELRVWIKDEFGNKLEETNIKMIFKKFIRLIQISSNVLILDKTVKELPSKIKKIDELVEQIIKRGEKVIIWTTFIYNITLFKTRYSKFGSVIIHGGVPTEQRTRNVEKFQNNPEINVLIANPASAGSGLTLTAANNAIYIDRDFKWINWSQSQDRIHRIGQNKDCNYYILIYENSIDEYIDHMLKYKTKVSDNLLDGKSFNEEELKKVKEELITKILRI
jgi:SNF2 family DNA or RNA helicase